MGTFHVPKIKFKSTSDIEFTHGTEPLNLDDLNTNFFAQFHHPSTNVYNFDRRFTLKEMKNFLNNLFCDDNLTENPLVLASTFDKRFHHNSRLMYHNS
jgi:hypothetical protein